MTARIGITEPRSRSRLIPFSLSSRQPSGTPAGIGITPAPRTEPVSAREPGSGGQRLFGEWFPATVLAGLLMGIAGFLGCWVGLATAPAGAQASRRSRVRGVG